MNRLVVAAMLALSLSASVASSGPTLAQAPNVVPDGKAVVVVYRISALTGAAYRHNVYLDGKLVASLSSGGYTHFPVSPGAYEVGTGNDKNLGMRTAKISPTSGELVYVAYNAGRDLSTPASLNSVRCAA